MLSFSKVILVCRGIMKKLLEKERRRMNNFENITERHMESKQKRTKEKTIDNISKNLKENTAYSSLHNIKETDLITINILYPQLLDKLNVLAAEYSVSRDYLVNVAIVRLMEDVEFFRKLRGGKLESNLSYSPSSSTSSK